MNAWVRFSAADAQKTGKTSKEHRSRLLRPTGVVKKIAAGARRVAELEFPSGAIEVEKTLFRIMPVDPCLGNRCRKRIDASVGEIDDDRPARPADRIGAAQVQDSGGGGPFAARRSRRQ